MPVNTLFEYYTQKGQPLLPKAQRFNDPGFAAAASAAGVSKETYTGSAAQNNSILSRLQGSGGSLEGTLTKPTPGGGAADPGSLPGTPPLPDTGLNIGQTNVSDLGNFRVALRTALEEAGKQRQGVLAGTLGGLNIKTPGTIGAISDLLRSNVQPSVEAVFSDYYKAYETASEFKKKELDRILELRLEFGSAIPDSVTTLAEAMKFVTPLIDQERDLERKERLAKMAEDQGTDNNIMGYATCLSTGASASECGVPTNLRAAAIALSEKLFEDEITGAFNTEKQNITDRIGAKRSTYDAEREAIWNRNDLEPDERRMMLDFIDGQEADEKAAKTQAKADQREASRKYDVVPSTTGGQTTPAMLLPKGTSQPYQDPTGGADPFKLLFEGFGGSK